MSNSNLDRIIDIVTNQGELNIILKSKIEFRYFVVFGLVVGFVGFYSICKEVMNGLEDYGILLHLLGSIVFLMVFMSVLIISLWGREIVTVNKDELWLQRTIFGIGRKRIYKLSKIKCIHYMRHSIDENNISGKGGCIQFYYEGIIVRFAENINKEVGISLMDSLRNCEFMGEEKFGEYNALESI